MRHLKHQDDDSKKKHHSGVNLALLFNSLDDIARMVIRAKIKRASEFGSILSLTDDALSLYLRNKKKKNDPQDSSIVDKNVDKIKEADLKDIIAETAKSMSGKMLNEFDVGNVLTNANIPKHLSTLADKADREREIIKKLSKHRSAFLALPKEKRNEVYANLINGYNQHMLPIIGKEASVTREKDMELFHQWKSDPSSNNLQSLMNQLEPIVRNETNKYIHSGINQTTFRAHARDLVFDALHKYDPEKSLLSTHITNSLKKLSRQAIFSQQAVRKPEQDLYGHRKVLKIKAELEQDLGHEPDEIELKEALGEHGTLGSFKPIIESFYSIASESGNTPMMAELSNNATSMYLLQNSLSPRQKDIFENTYVKPIPGLELAKKLNVSPQFISKQKRLIEGKMRDYYKATQGILS